MSHACINLPCINACKCVVSRAHMTACWFIYSLSISIIIVQPSIYSCVVLCVLAYMCITKCNNHETFIFQYVCVVIYVLRCASLHLVHRRIHYVRCSARTWQLYHCFLSLSSMQARNMYVCIYLYTNRCIILQLTIEVAVCDESAWIHRQSISFFHFGYCTPIRLSSFSLGFDKSSQAVC